MNYGAGRQQKDATHSTWLSLYPPFVLFYLSYLVSLSSDFNHFMVRRARIMTTLIIHTNPIGIKIGANKLVTVGLR